MREWRAHHDATNDQTEPADDAGVSLSMVLDGRRRLDGNLDTMTGQLVHTALQAAEPARSDGIPLDSPKRRRAEALGACASSSWITTPTWPPTPVPTGPI
jgi:hypothetical protein